MMNPRAARALALASFIAALAAAPIAADESATRRIALVVGSNAGGSGREKLRYAASDARSFSRVLTDLGGVRGPDLILLIDPSLASFRAAAGRLAVLAGEAAAEGQRCELVLYYSGHSDVEGLLLGSERLAYRELRASIEGVNAVVRVAILDSCFSGGLTRAKGGAARPAFLLDESSDMKGHAYITSSSENEAAQESDRIGGSFFTHHLVSALRGAADSSGEGRVTLNEAYAFAFRETLASTEATRYGPQHPAYDISLTGSGDLVITDIRSAQATLAFAEELEGAIFVRGAGGELVVELDKTPGKRMEVGLPLGTYALSAEKGTEKLQAEITLAAGSHSLLSRADFKRVSPEATAPRGLALAPTESAEPEPLSDSLAADLALSPAPSAPATFAGYPVSVDMTLMPDFSKGLFASEEDKIVALGLLWGRARNLRGLQLSTLLNADSGDMVGFQFAGLANAVKGRSRGAQFAPIANVAKGGFAGAQVFSLVNVAGGASGGAQIGLVNVADRISGAQIGLVNVSRRLNGGALGLVNIESGGVRSVEAIWGSSNAVQVGFKLGTRYTYNLFSAGIGLVEDGEPFSLGLGLGGHLPIGAFYGDLDLSWRVCFDAQGVTNGLEARLLAGLPRKGSGLVLGCALKGILPGLSRGSEGALASEFGVEPRFLIGVKL